MTDVSGTSQGSSANNAQEEQQPAKHSWDETLRTIIYALLLAVIFRSFAYEPFHIPSGSMKSNLLVGDYLFVSKLSYGYSRYSFPLGLPLFEGRVLESTPKRGDVVVFRPPKMPRIDYIKRLVGLPGDRIQVKNGILFINGQELQRRRVEDYIDDEDPRNVKVIPRYVETMPEGKSYTVLDETSSGAVDNTQEYVVPEGHYFMMGDNRDNSTDSRYLDQVGFIPAENLVGRADRILFSSNQSAQFWEVWKWPSSLRFDRFFMKVP